MIEYTQLRFEKPTMAKDLTEYFKPGNLLDGWELVCIHTGYPSERITGISDHPFYIATFRRES